jgi:hypothetical protein
MMLATLIVVKAVANLPLADTEAQLMRVTIAIAPRATS